MYNYHLIHVQEAPFEQKNSSAVSSCKAFILLHAATFRPPFLVPCTGAKHSTPWQAEEKREIGKWKYTGAKGEEENVRVVFWLWERSFVQGT